MEWQKGDVICIYDGYDKSEEYVWVLEVTKAKKASGKDSNYYKIYNINYGSTYSTFLDGDGSGLTYSLFSRQK